VPPPATRRRGAVAIALALVLGLSWLMRETQDQRVELPGRHGWFTTDPDTQYHLRRVERVLRSGLPVAERDDYLNFPDGSAIPWPPYCTLLAYGLLGPLAPEDPGALHAWTEMHVASLPLLFGVLTSLVVAVAGWRLAGWAGALLAGSTHALSLASIATSKSGNGDHHAWIALLWAALLLCLSTGFARGALERARAGFFWGAAAGVLAGVALGSWVASLLYVIPVQLCLGWLVIVHSREPRPGLPALGFAFHVAALLVLLPAVLTSPWRETQPWLVVNLTWFHPVFLLLGALVFAPLFALRSRSRILALYPAAVACALALLGLFVARSSSAPAAGIREGFEWLRRTDAFMGAVWESRGLLGPGAAFNAFEVLGAGIVLLPFVWAGAAWLAFRGRRVELLPWVVGILVLAPQTARQVRFADAFVVPMSVLLAWGCVTALSSPAVQRRLAGKRLLRRLPAGALFVLILAGVGLAQRESVARTWRELSSPRTGLPPGERPSALAVRGMCEWIREHTPAPPDYAVLALWHWGHTIEWAAERPTVATNFGFYVGEEGFRTPSRFFLAEDPALGEALLEKRRARYVLVTSDLSGALPAQVASAAPERAHRYFSGDAASGIQIKMEWFRTLGARLLFDGRVYSFEGELGRPLDFLRLVHVSPLRDSRYQLRGKPSPYGWVWEHVPGAILEARGSPGEELRAELSLRYATGHYELAWSDRVRADSTGTARLRIPYATEGSNGDGVASGPLHWTFGDREGTLRIPQRAIYERGSVRIAGSATGEVGNER
jgi:asparagine N-glycosylation enzyme membrane subunit Stt3